MSLINSMRWAALAAGFTLALSGCGTRMLKEPVAGDPAQVAITADEGVTVSVHGLVYRDGPGSGRAVRTGTSTRFRSTTPRRTPSRSSVSC